MTVNDMTLNDMTVNDMTFTHMPWDAFQREMLAALGHTLYVSADGPAMRMEEHVVDVRTSVRSTRDRNVADPRTSERDMRPRKAASPDGLMRALLRAANLGEHDAAALQTCVPPLDALTGNTDAKRKLWPTLRAMRAQRLT